VIECVRERMCECVNVSLHMHDQVCEHNGYHHGALREAYHVTVTHCVKECVCMAFVFKLH
jgi:hypothetical protein